MTQAVKASSSDLDDTYRSLWSNWAFRLSLSSNELFHSNILQYLAEEQARVQVAPTEIPLNEFLQDECDEERPDKSVVEPQTITESAAKMLIQLLAEGDGWEIQPQIAIDGAVLKVAREWSDMDLVLLRQVDNGNQWKPVLGLEVKIKAYPTTAQLRRYMEKLEGAPLFLLTGMGHAAANNLPNVHAVTFAGVAERLETWKESAVKREYQSLCSQLSRLFITLSSLIGTDTDLKTIEQLARQAQPYRLHSIVWKVWAATLEKHCRLAEDGNGAFFHSYSGFTNTGNVGACWRWPTNDKWLVSKCEESIGIGVQVEGNTFRLFLNVVHPDLGSKLEARKRVEKCLLRLTMSQGIFAQNPGLTAYLQRWSETGREAEFIAWWQQGIQARALDSEKLFKTAEEAVEVAYAKRDFSLPGYANGTGNGFADYRLRLANGATIGGIACCVKKVLSDDTFSHRDDQSNLLVSVVKDFGMNSTEWVRKWRREI